MPSIDVANADLLLTTTKQVRKRLDLSRPVPRELLLECIDIASHAPMGGNQERNRWMIIDDPAIKAEIAPLYQSVGRPSLAAGGANADGRQARVVESASFLVDHVAEVPAWVLAMRLDRLAAGAPNVEVAGYHGSVAPGVWSFQLAARARGLGSAWTTFHLAHEEGRGDPRDPTDGDPDRPAPCRVLHGRLLLPRAAPSGERDHLREPLEGAGALAAVGEVLLVALR